MVSNKNFPNGFTNWLETSIEITEGLVRAIDKDLIELDGRGGLWETVEDYTDEFEKLYEGELWIDKEWFDTLDDFILNKIKKLQKN